MEIGETALSPQEVQQVVHEMGSAYRGNRYHLLQKNCNAFSNDLCIRLTGKPAPAWVRAKVEGTVFPIGRLTADKYGREPRVGSLTAVRGWHR